MKENDSRKFKVVLSSRSMIDPSQMHENVILTVGWNRQKNRLCKRAFRFPW